MAETSRKVLTRFGDYRDMMSDTIRMDAYDAAIAKVVQPGDVVVDLGAGLGILSMLAARAGARHVYAIEKSDAASLGRRLVSANGLADKITFIEAHSFDVELPEKADVLISETLGSFGLEENTLLFMVDARDRLLKPDARILPAELTPMLAPVELAKHHGDSVFWDNLRGFDFSPAMDEVCSRMGLAEVSPQDVLAQAIPVVQIDFASVHGKGVSTRLLFTIERPGTIHGLGTWFETTLCEGITIDTGPAAPATHWKQGFFPFKEPVAVITGDVLEVRIRIGPIDAEGRAADSAVTYEYRCTQLANES